MLLHHCEPLHDPLTSRTNSHLLPPKNPFVLWTKAVPRPKRFSTAVFVHTVTKKEISLAGLDASKRDRGRCDCYDLYDQHIPYLDAWRWQRFMVDTRTAGVQEGNDVDDAVVILQHPPVYTLGTRSSDKYLLFDRDSPPCDLYRTERGGEVTYHGPGQLVMYPILNLRHHKMDLHWYLRSLEEVVIRALWAVCAIEASRIEGLTGVWVGEQKVAAIGVRVSRWITYHGLALNVSTDLAPFKNIIPCGISDRPVGSVLEILKGQTLLQQVKSGTDVSKVAGNKLDPHYLVDLLHRSLLLEFSEIFQVDLTPVSKGGPTLFAGLSSPVSHHV